MKNGVDYIFDYSDLNRLHLRIQLLTGPYKDLIFETHTIESDISEKGNFLTFNHIFYQVPFIIANTDELNKLKTYMAEVICHVVDDRRNDPMTGWNMIAADEAMRNKARFCKIKIDDKFYEVAA